MEVGFTCYVVPKTVTEVQLTYEVRSKDGSLKEEGAVNQSRVVEVHEEDTITIRVPARAKQD